MYVDIIRTHRTIEKVYPLVRVSGHYTTSVCLYVCTCVPAVFFDVSKISLLWSNTTSKNIYDMWVCECHDVYLFWCCFEPGFKFKIRRIEKELLVYDTTDMIGAIGGSLGLFLGFSFFDLISKCIDISIDNLFKMM